MRGHDYDNAGKAAIAVTSPWGLGLLGRSAAGFTSRAMVQNGVRLGGWLLNTRDNHVPAAGDFDGDGRAELLITSPWGVGLLERSGATWTAPFLTASGTRIGNWMVDTAVNRFQTVGDLDEDGREEILVTSPWGIGLMKKVGSSLTCPLLLPNGTRIEGWLLNTADNAFPLAADLDGDGRAELLVKSPWGIAVLRFDGTSLSTALIAANGTRLGEWVLNTAHDRFELAADLDGNGRAEILVSSPWGLGVLGWSGGELSSTAMAASGSSIGPWRLETDKNRFGPAGGIGGTGRAEVLLASPWGMGVLAWEDGRLSVPALAANDSWLGQWRLNTRDNRFNLAGDFEGDGRDRVLITSPWGIGLLRRDGSILEVSPMAQNGTALGDWRLNTQDNDLEVGHWQGTALILYHDDWKSVVDQSRARWVRRGLAVVETDEAADGIARLKALATTAKPGDRCFVYLAGHGSDPRPYGDTDPSFSGNHFVLVNSGEIYGHQVAPLFRALAAAGVDLTVLDGSCNGGETVLQAQSQRYAAMATTGVNSPGLTSFPAMHEALDAEPKPSAFSLWWSEPRRLASALNGVIVRGVPSRYHQRLHRNDDSPLSNVFFRTAVNVFKALDLGGWNLHYQYCYLYPYIYPTDFEKLSTEEKAKFTNDTRSFVDAMDKLVDACRPTVAALGAVLADSALMERAASIYTSDFALAWRALAGDNGWDVAGDPDRHKAELADLAPNCWQGISGFHAMVGELRSEIAQFQRWYDEQKALLWQLDAAVQAAAERHELRLPRLQAGAIQPRLPSDLRYYQEFNNFERELTTRSIQVLARARTLRLPPQRRLSAEVARVKAVLKAGGRRSIDDLAAEFRAIGVVHLQRLGRASFLMSLVEDSVAGAESGGGRHPGDVCLL